MARQSLTLPGMAPVGFRAARVLFAAAPVVTLALLISLGVVLPARAVGLNDTGFTRCWDAVGVVPCDTALDDGRYGRDAAARAGALPKIGAGASGFDFTKIANSGSSLPASAALGNGDSDWACTLDNVTGRMWEVKTDDGGLRDKDWRYNWYSSDDSTNGGVRGDTGWDSCGTTLPSGQCNTEAYVNAVNAAQLCGYSNWRMPSWSELKSIVHYESFPTIDKTYFPNTKYIENGKPTEYWSGTPLAVHYSIPAGWAVNFFHGGDETNYRTFDVDWNNPPVPYPVRLVRSPSP